MKKLFIYVLLIFSVLGLLIRLLPKKRLIMSLCFRIATMKYQAYIFSIQGGASGVVNADSRQLKKVIA